eukprot:1198188-Amorphochlora_amoeboformis.AAC.1
MFLTFPLTLTWAVKNKRVEKAKAAVLPLAVHMDKTLEASALNLSMKWVGDIAPGNSEAASIVVSLQRRPQSLSGVAGIPENELKTKCLLTKGKDFRLKMNKGEDIDYFHLKKC